MFVSTDGGGQLTHNGGQILIDNKDYRHQWDLSMINGRHNLSVSSVSNN